MRGKGYQRLRHFPACRDHPRLCGEKCVACQLEMLARGSPPPMRGKDASSVFKPPSLRITPAYAGKRDAVFPALDCVEDHPRLCGEKLSKRAMISLQKGSPPPMRGKVVSTIKTHITFGITPAYAGKSPCTYSFELATRDHPRLCGEKHTRHCATWKQ